MGWLSGWAGPGRAGMGRVGAGRQWAGLDSPSAATPPASARGQPPRSVSVSAAAPFATDW